jgi:hypothetical protein
MGEFVSNFFRTNSKEEGRAPIFNTVDEIVQIQRFFISIPFITTLELN